MIGMALGYGLGLGLSVAGSSVLASLAFLAAIGWVFFLSPACATICVEGDRAYVRFGLNSLVRERRVSLSTLRGTPGFGSSHPLSGISFPRALGEECFYAVTRSPTPEQSRILFLHGVLKHRDVLVGFSSAGARRRAERQIGSRRR